MGNMLDIIITIISNLVLPLLKDIIFEYRKESRNKENKKE